MDFFECLHCHAVVQITEDTKNERSIGMKNQVSVNGSFCLDPMVKLSLYFCPKCEKYSLRLADVGTHPGIGKFTFTRPALLSNFSMPEYVPENIQTDYFEAWDILELSPKASATLARRCLQGMIHDFWGITGKNLNAEISELHKQDIPEQQWQAIDSLRKLGNIGAHMEKDVNLIVDIDPDEALKLLKLIEYLITDWYISRHNRETLYREIGAISGEKQEARNSHPSED